MGTIRREDVFSDVKPDFLQELFAGDLEAAVGGEALIAIGFLASHCGGRLDVYDVSRLNRCWRRLVACFVEFGERCDFLILVDRHVDELDINMMALAGRTFLQREDDRGEAMRRAERLRCLAASRRPDVNITITFKNMSPEGAPATSSAVRPTPTRVYVLARSDCRLLVFQSYAP